MKPFTLTAVIVLAFIALVHLVRLFLGWDVVVTADGIRLLEGNANTGMNVLQVHGPLLSDPRIRRFYESHGGLNVP